MHDFVLALGHLLWRSLIGLVGGWMATSLLALGVGIINYWVPPYVDALLHGDRIVKKPRLTGSIIVSLATWLLLFGVSVIHTVYSDHATLVSQNQSLTVKVTAQQSELQNDGQEVGLLKEKLAAFQEVEPPDSLRRRTLKLADEMQEYLIMRVQKHPPFAYPDSSQPNPSEEQKQKIQVSQRYDQQTYDYYSKHFKDWNNQRVQR